MAGAQRGLVSGPIAAVVVAILAVAGAAAGDVPSAHAQAAHRDQIGDLLRRNDQPARPQPGARPPSAAPGPSQSGQTPTGPAQTAAPPPDPREGEVAYEQAKRLMAAISAMLEDTAKSRAEGRKLPARDEFLIPPIFAETREDRDRKVQALLDSALAIVTDVPVVETQKKVETLRRNIRDLDDQIAKLKEKQLTAPKDAVLAGVLTDTVDSLAVAIVDKQKRIELNRAEIAAAKAEIAAGLQRSGLTMSAEQVDLLLESVLSGDLVRLMAVFNAVKAIDQQLAKLMAATGENLNAARKYFAMHAALFALLVHTQDQTIAKIDTMYLPKLDAILADVTAARQRTGELLKAENRPDQKRALDGNREAQRIAEEAAKSYKRYLKQQREQIAKARTKAAHDLKIADNTYETVEASVQLRALMREGTQSFDALQRLEAPTFDQLFRNEELRREFENLTRKLDTPTS
jgi:polyhydroxyalkanoate synthesis regulator phasin